MFRPNETYFTKAGYEARVICVDAGAKYGAITCNVVALVTIKGPAGASTCAYMYSDDGKLSGTGNATHDLVSNEPNAEELELIREIKAIGSSSDDRNTDERMLKVIRQLRKK